MSLRDRDIEDLLSALESGDISDDGLEDEDDDKERFYSKVREIIHDLEEENVDTPDDDNDPPLVQDEEADPVHEPEPRQGNQNLLNSCFDKRKLIWKPDSLVFDESNLTHKASVTDPEIADLDTPYRCFLHYFTPEFIKKIVNETNLYATQQNPTKSFSISDAELKKYLGILLFMSVEHFPSVRSYWNEKFGYDPVSKVMPVNRFEAIRRHLHFNDNIKHLPKEHPDHDKAE
ncbi:unnamed protein product [Parnassius mnemosyne]|uniref:PiggyBac transposable element-derived protein domain-containing protein n=1 Tax=Parnassius mnemosyne TaxID=213953 RepID=A0AAV1M9G1_9NEOP